MVPQGCPCPGVGGPAVSGPQLQSLRGVLALMWMAYSCSLSGTYPVGMEPVLPRAHLQPHVLSAVSPSASLSDCLLTCLLSLLADAFSYVCSSRNTLCSSDQLKVWYAPSVSVPTGHDCKRHRAVHGLFPDRAPCSLLLLKPCPVHAPYILEQQVPRNCLDIHLVCKDICLLSPKHAAYFMK